MTISLPLKNNCSQLGRFAELPSAAQTAYQSPPKSIRLNLQSLIKLLPTGQFLLAKQSLLGCRPTHVVSWFLLPRQFHRDPKFTTFSGTCKNHAIATQTATHQTAGPLEVMLLITVCCVIKIVLKDEATVVFDT